MDDLDRIVGSVGNIYVRQGLSSPSQLREAARHWLDLELGEIIGAVQDHLDKYRSHYVSGSGDKLFSMVQAEIQKASDAKSPKVAGKKRPPKKPDEPAQERLTFHPGALVDGFIDDDAQETETD